jgi:hypothetical protein
MDMQNHVFLTSALVEGEWSASCLDRFTPREGASGIDRIGGYLDPQKRTGRPGF